MTVSVKITGLTKLNKAITELEKKVANHQKTAIRRGLNAGAKELKKAIKPHVPVIRSSTKFRQPGVIKKNIRHKTTIDRNGNRGKTVIFISNKNKGVELIARERNRRDAKGILRTGPIKVYTNDPYYWHMVDRGTINMPGSHFIKQGEIKTDWALNTAKMVVEEEIRKPFKK